MTLRIQNACGHGGTRLKHVLVCAEHELRPPVPVWQRLLCAFLLVAAAFCTSRLDMPGVPVSKKVTIMDVSRLDVKTPPERPKLAPPVEKPAVEAPKRSRTMYALDGRPPQHRPRQALQDAAAPKSARVRRDPSQPLELNRPAIARASGYESAPAPLYLPVARERRVAGAMELAGGGKWTAAARLRRETGAGEESAVPSPSSTYIYRARSAAAESAPSPAVSAALDAPQRKSRAVEVAAYSQAPRVAAVRSAPPVAVEQEAKPSDSPYKERSKNPGAAGGSAQGVALSRGVSLMSLKICDSALQQEEAIKAVLSVVGSRRSCCDEKGEFQFKGTKRVSSFNLMIFPSKGREPSQRCEELEYAYDCLKQN